MEFGAREILIILGIVVMLGILLDGFRRVRHARTGTLKVHRRKQPIFEDEGFDDHPGELLSAEVRVTLRDPESAEQVSDSIKRSLEQNTQRCTSAFRDISQVRDANAGRFQPVAPTEPAPLRDQPQRQPAADHDRPPPGRELSASRDQEPLETPGRIPGADGPPPLEPASDSRQPASLDAFDIDEGDGWQEPAAPGTEPEPWGVTRDDLDGDIGEPFHLEPPEERTRDEQSPRRKPFWEDQPQARNPQSQRPAESRRSEQAPAADPDVAAPRQKRPSEPEMVIVLHVMAKKDTAIPGPVLLEALLANGLRYGSMQIFHRHEHRDGSGPVHFSLANSLKPGTFDLSAMDSFETPGVTLFMPIEGLPNALESFDELIKTAQNLARVLNAVLKDETRSALTKQTIEHQRQQIIEYTRRSFTLTH